MVDTVGTRHELEPAPGWLTGLIARPKIDPRPVDDHPFAQFRRPTNTTNYVWAALEDEVRAGRGRTRRDPQRSAQPCSDSRSARSAADGSLDADLVAGALLAAARDAGLPESEAICTIRSGIRSRGAA